MADWVSPSVFGTKFVCKLMAASRSSGCKAAVMSPVGEVMARKRAVMSLREVMAATQQLPRQSRNNPPKVQNIAKRRNLRNAHTTSAKPT